MNILFPDLSSVMVSKATNNEQSADSVRMEMRKELDVNQPKIWLNNSANKSPTFKNLDFINVYDETQKYITNLSAFLSRRHVWKNPDGGWGKCDCYSAWHVG